MKEKVEQLKFVSIVTIITQAFILATYVFFSGVTQTMFIVIFFLIISSALIFYLIGVYEKELLKNIVEVSEVLGEESKDAFIVGGLGLLVYDQAYNIIWMSDYFDYLKIKRKDEKITTWIPEIAQLFNGDLDIVTIEYDNYIFEVSRNQSTRLLYFKDITKEYNITNKYSNESLVMGLVHLDNYQEYTQYEEEQRVYFIDSIVKQNLINWADDLGIFIRRLQNDRYLLLTNEKIFKEIIASNFNILQKVRKEAQDNDLLLSLSMGFARGTSDYLQLETTANDLLELAQSRGGDQVAVKTVGEDVKYFGGHSQSRERRSKARVRVIAQTIRELIKNSDKVIIIGHKNADFDCFGASLVMSRIVQANRKTAYIVSESGGLEAKLESAYNIYNQNLLENHTFISEEEALDLLTYETLVLMVDHHNDEVSGSPNLLERANKIAIVDHHRRRSDYNFQPILAYIESAASSTGELVVEFLPYQEKRTTLTAIEATFVYAGIIVDTNGFNNRVGARTFESASLLQRYGANITLANELLQDSYEDVMLKNKIYEKAVLDHDASIVFASIDDNTIIPRALISQGADELLSVKEVNAVFVISQISDNEIGISARSNGSFNVQKIMESMGGGGHFNAAATQIKEKNIEEILAELHLAVDKYLEEVYEIDESNIVT